MSDPELYSPTELHRLILRPDADPIRASEYPPEGEGCGVYALFNKDGGLLYIGCSLGVGYRVLQHRWAARRRDRSMFTDYSYVEVPPELLEAVESAHIHALTPPENTLPRVLWDRHDEAVALIREIWGPKQ